MNLVNNLLNNFQCFRLLSLLLIMSKSRDPDKDEEEYVLLDLDAVSEQVDIQPNAPYVLSVRLTIFYIIMYDL